MDPLKRPLRPSTTATVAFAGWIAGLVSQWLSSRFGGSTLTMPWTYPTSLALIAVVLLTLGLILRAQVRDERRRVNPFTAVRVLIGARAGQLVGAMSAGVAIGVILPLLFRFVWPPLPIWLPTVMTAIVGGGLLTCGIVVEHLCKIPPEDDDHPSASPPNEPQMSPN